MSVSSFVLNLAKDPAQLNKDYQGAGRGIVICGGGSYLPSAYVAIRHVRRTGCSLPIELWVIDWTEIPQEQIEHFQKLNVSLRLAVKYSAGYRVLRGYECKAISLVNSSFEEVLLLDADNVVLADPTLLFESEPFQANGQLFWPDFAYSPDARFAITEQTWTDFELTPQPGLELESGQLMVNRKRCWKELQLTEVLNQHSTECYDRYTWGDKDTFVIAWRVLGTQYFVMPHRPDSVDGAKYQGQAIWQYNLDRTPLFQHQRKHLFAPHIMQDIASPKELFVHESVLFLNDYYEFAPWKGNLSVDHFNVRR